MRAESDKMIAVLDPADNTPSILEVPSLKVKLTLAGLPEDFRFNQKQQLYLSWTDWSSDETKVASTWRAREGFYLLALAIHDTSTGALLCAFDASNFFEETKGILAE